MRTRVQRAFLISVAAEKFPRLIGFLARATMRAMKSKKHWLRSRTILINVLAAMLAFAVDNLHLLGPVLSPKFFAAMAFTLPLANIALRILTTQAVSLRKPKEFR